MVTTGPRPHSQDYLDQPMLLAKTEKGAPRKCWLWLVFSFSRHQKSGFVGETISKMPLWDMAPSGPESHQNGYLQADGGTSPAESVASVASVLWGVVWGPVYLHFQTHPACFKGLHLPAKGMRGRQLWAGFTRW